MRAAHVGLGIWTRRVWKEASEAGLDFVERWPNYDQKRSRGRLPGRLQRSYSASKPEHGRAKWQHTAPQQIKYASTQLL